MIAQKDLDFIRTTAFFRGLGAEDLAEALRTLRAAVKTYDRGELILHAGEPTERWCFRAASPSRAMTSGAPAPS